MNSFANVLFSGFFGWLKSAAQAVYRTLSEPESATLLTKVADHWMILVIILLVAGTAVDLIVYLARWQPYKVWSSFFRRITKKKCHRKEQSGMHQTALFMTEPVPENDAYIPPDDTLWTPEDLTYMDPLTDIEYQDMEEEDWPITESTGTRKRRLRKEKKGIRHLVRTILAVPDEDEPSPLHYVAAQPPVDKRDAYGSAYIPPQWKQPEEKIVRRKRSDGRNTHA